MSGHSYGSNYVAMSDDLFISPVVEASFAFHYPALLGAKRFQELKDEDRIASHRITVTEHGRPMLAQAEVGEGIATGSGETRFRSLTLPFPDGHRLHIKPGLFIALQSKPGHDFQVPASLPLLQTLTNQPFRGTCTSSSAATCSSVAQTSWTTSSSTAPSFGKPGFDGMSIGNYGAHCSIRGLELIGGSARGELEERGILSGEQRDELVYMGSCMEAGVEEVVDAVGVSVEAGLGEGQSLGDWQAQGGEPNAERPDLAGRFLCRLKYEGNMRWVHLTQEELEALSAPPEAQSASMCLACEEKDVAKEEAAPKFAEDGSWARVGGETYHVGDFVCFDPAEKPKLEEKAETDLKDYPEPYEENQYKLKQVLVPLCPCNWQ